MDCVTIGGVPVDGWCHHRPSNVKLETLLNIELQPRFLPSVCRRATGDESKRTQERKAKMEQLTVDRDKEEFKNKVERAKQRLAHAR